jgi:hypothetical protein
MVYDNDLTLGIVYIIPTAYEKWLFQGYFILHFCIFLVGQTSLNPTKLSMLLQKNSQFRVSIFQLFSILPIR